MNTKGSSYTLQEKLDEFMQEFESSCDKMRGILKDLKYTNHEGKDFQQAKSQMENVCFKIFLLKGIFD